MNNNCFQFERITTNPSKRLFCFHHAGGSAFTYISWQKYISDNIDIYPHQLSGRGNRSNEDNSVSITDISTEAAEYIHRLADKDIIFVGHSMGGVIAYYTAYLLKKKYAVNVKKIFITGSTPNLSYVLNEKYKYSHKMNDSAFCNMILKFGALDKNSLSLLKEHSEFIDIIKSDFDLISNCTLDISEPIDSDIEVYYGSSDDVTNKKYCNSWSNYTNGKVNVTKCSGGHFFINNYYKNICKDISQCI